MPPPFAPLAAVILGITSTYATSGRPRALKCAGALAPGTRPGGLEVSLVQLIATPERYDGKQVRVMGYLHLEFEGQAIYLHRQDFAEGLTKNGLWVEFTRGLGSAAAKCSDRYVLLEGRFRATDHGHLGLWSGTLDSIYRVDSWGRK